MWLKFWDENTDDYLFDPDESDDVGWPKTRRDGTEWASAEEMLGLPPELDGLGENIRDEITEIGTEIGSEIRRVVREAPRRAQSRRTRRAGRDTRESRETRDTRDERGSRPSRRRGGWRAGRSSGWEGAVEDWVEGAPFFGWSSHTCPICSCTCQHSPVSTQPLCVFSMSLLFFFVTSYPELRRCECGGRCGWGAGGARTSAIGRTIEPAGSLHQRGGARG